jgi:enediyne biosynthesis protein E5
MNGDSWSRTSRLGGLRRFAIAITVLNILGHTWFGFEQSLAQPLAALATAYSMELALELIDSWAKRRRPNFLGGFRNFVDFLLSAHISGLAVGMLLYANDRLWPIVFATIAALGSKSLIRARVGQGSRHLFNPSNFGISITLLAFPWVGISPPYHFTENLDSAGDWILPAAIVVSGTLLNARFTKKLPLIAAWLTVFAAQAMIRSFVFGTPLIAPLIPMTGVAFILYTFYMVTDPATTPSKPWAQAVFGAAVAVAYSMLMVSHAVFGLFFALTIVSTIRALMIYARNLAGQRAFTKVEPQAAPRVTAAAREV